MSFKKPNRKRNLRQRCEAEEEEEEDATKARMEDIREIQKSRGRPSGLSSVELALGTAAVKAAEETPSAEDPFKSVQGGLIDLKALKRGKLKKASLEEDIKGGRFSKESCLRDEDEEMRKYVEKEIARRKGVLDDGPKASDKKREEEDAELFALPEKLRKYQSAKTEESMSNQMLVGIPEFELGLDSKIRNIEETEAAKQRLLSEAEKKKERVEEKTAFHQNVWKDKSLDYVQHRAFAISRTTDMGREGAGPSAKKELEEVMTDAGGQNIVGDEAVPFMMYQELHGHEDQVWDDLRVFGWRFGES